MITAAFLGLGAMGLPMARNLLRKGIPLRVWNRTPEKALALRADGAVPVPTPREAAAGADIVCTMLADPPAVEETASGPKGLAAVSQKVLRFGGVGQGSAMKLANNLLFGAGLAVFGEALGLAKRLGLDDAQATEWLLSVPALAPYVKLKWEFFRKDPAAVAFRLALMQKDLRLAVESGGGDAALPVVAATRDVFARADAAGFGGRDMAAVIPFAVGAAQPPKKEPAP